MQYQKNITGQFDTSPTQGWGKVGARFGQGMGTLATNQLEYVTIANVIRKFNVYFSINFNI